MIIGLSTLIAILFFGGVGETFLIDKLEKGAKECIVEKERKKEVTAELKVSAKYIKAFNKKRKNQFKDFKEMNASRETKREEMAQFFDNLMDERREFQGKVIDDRLRIIELLKPGEWDSIMVYSQKAAAKKMEKVEKKQAKGKVNEPFTKTFDAIQSSITNDDNRHNVKNALAVFVASEKKTIEQLASMNSIDSDILTNENASRDDLANMAKSLNALRKKAYDDLVDFHFAVKELTNEEEWKQIMKVFNKDLVMTSH